MTKRSDFMPSSVAYGLRLHEFEHLAERDRRKLVRLMARIAEQSYRRGAQQGARFAERGVITDAAGLCDWRFDHSLDKAPRLDSAHGATTSVERLFMECGVLLEIGFEEPSAGRNNETPRPATTREGPE